MLRLGLVSVRIKAHVAGALARNRLCRVHFCFGFYRIPRLSHWRRVFFFFFCCRRYCCCISPTNSHHPHLLCLDIRFMSAQHRSRAHFPRSHLQPCRAMFTVFHSLTFCILSLFLWAQLTAKKKTKKKELETSIFALYFTFIYCICKLYTKAEGFISMPSSDQQVPLQRGKAGEWMQHGRR